MRYTVDLCAGFAKIGEVLAFRLSGKLRHLAAGSWTLDTTSEALRVADPATVDSIVVRDETRQVVYAGIFRPGPDNATYERTRTASGYDYRWSGTDIYGILGTRLAFPTPATTEPWADGYDTNTGVASTVAATYIADNLGVGALADRQIGGLTIVDPAIGPTITWDARLLNIGELVGDICKASDLAVDAVWDGTNISYSFRTPVDYSPDVILSDRGDLEDAQISETAPSGTWVLGAGQGELAARVFRTADTLETGLGRVEYFYDNTNIADGTTMQTAVDARSTQLTDQVIVTARAADGAPNLPEWRTDYLLGDWLGVQIDSQRFAAQVTSVTMDITADRQSFVPEFGDGISNDVTALLDKVDTVASTFARRVT